MSGRKKTDVAQSTIVTRESATNDVAEGSRTASEAPLLARRHLLLGWASLLGFQLLGLVLEGLHGFKIGWYLNVSTSTRRLLFTLGHAHGTLLGLVHIAFAVTLLHVPGLSGASRDVASRALIAASLLLPTGFLLGGFFLHGDDPGLGILLVPPGGLLLVVSAALTLRAVWRGREDVA